MQSVISFLGSGFCHQMTERTLHAGVWAFPVCARDTGMHFAFIITLIVLALLLRKPTRGPFYSKPLIALIVALLVPFALDGVTSYAGLRETTNLIRYATGYLCGISMGLLIHWALVDIFGKSPASSEGARTLESSRVLLPVLTLSLLAGAVVYVVHPYLGFVMPLLCTLCMVGSITVVAGAVFGLVRPTRTFLLQWGSHVPFVLASVVAALVFMCLLALVKLNLLQLLMSIIG